MYVELEYVDGPAIKHRVSFVFLATFSFAVPVSNGGFESSSPAFFRSKEMLISQLDPFMANSRNSKRGACDRCRGQKLRCQPGGQSQDGATATCARCQRAGTACSYGIGKRPGRPSASSAAGAQPRRQISPTRALDGCVDSSKPNDNFGEQVNQNGLDQNWQPTHYSRNGPILRANTAS